MASRIDKFAKTARIFYALGNGTRLRIMMLLSEGEMSVNAICKKLKLSQSRTSNHIILLYKNGLVQVRCDGVQRFYSLADLSKHSLGKKSELTKAKGNAAKFGPVELILPKK